MESYRILIVDDDESLLKSLGRILRKEGYQLLFATSGNHALKILERMGVDMVISDYQMPGMNGLAFLKKVKKYYPHVLTIMMTGLEDMNIVVNAINEAGIYKFILKPWDSEDLKITIRRAVETAALIRERDELLQKVKTRDMILNELERQYPGITRVKRDADGNIII